MRPDKKKNRGRGRGHAVQAQTTAHDAGPGTSSQPRDKQEQPQEVKEQDVTNTTYTNNPVASQESEEEEIPRKNYSKREIFTSWEQWKRYDEPRREGAVEEEEEDVGLDFQRLLQAPVSADGHFHFKSEKLEAPPTGNLFAMDLEALADGLKTIPFYKQLDLPTSLFSESAIQLMDQEAAVASKFATELRACKQDEPPKPSLDKNSATIPNLEDSIVKQPLTPSVENIKISTSVISPIQNSSIVSQSSTSSSSSNTQVEAKNESNPVSPQVENITSEPPRTQRERKMKKSEPEDPPSTHVPYKVVQMPLPSTIEPFLDSIDVEPESTTGVFQSCATPSNVNSQDNNDLEAWLDSVLDD